MPPITLDFSSYISELTKNFTGREWVFDEIDRWLADPNGKSFLVIIGEPGVGKSAIAARLTQLRDLSAYHFCIARNANTLDPAIFARSLSHQLCSIDRFALGIIRGNNIDLTLNQNIQFNYGQIIASNIENLTLNAPTGIVAFTHAVLEPLRTLYVEGFHRQVTILVDSLDEAQQFKGAETIVDLLANARGVPRQVRFILTSRPDGNVLRHFTEQQVPHLLIDASRLENMQDIRRYVAVQLELSEELQTRLAEQNMSEELFANRIAEASEGNFLYVVWLLSAIAAGTQGLDDLEMLPQGLDGIYRNFLITRNLREDKREWSNYRSILGVIAAALEPLTAKQIARFSGLQEQVVRDILLTSQQFLEPTNREMGLYQFYHQSMIDFLIDENRAGDFWIDLSPIHQDIVSYYQKNSNGSVSLIRERIDEYGLRYLISHLAMIVEANPSEKRYKRQLVNLATDLQFVVDRIGLKGPIAVEMEIAALRRIQAGFWANARIGLIEAGFILGLGRLKTRYLNPKHETEILPKELTIEKETVLYTKSLLIKAPRDRVYQYAYELSCGRLSDLVVLDPEITIPEFVEEGRYFERSYDVYLTKSSTYTPIGWDVLLYVWQRFALRVKIPFLVKPKMGTLRLKVNMTSKTDEETQVAQEVVFVPTAFLINNYKDKEISGWLIKAYLADLQLAYFLVSLKTLAEESSHIGETLVKRHSTSNFSPFERVMFSILSLLAGWMLCGLDQLVPAPLRYLALPLWSAIYFGYKVKKNAAIEKMEKEFGYYVPQVRGMKILFLISLSLLALEIIVFLLWKAWQNGLIQRLWQLVNQL